MCGIYYCITCMCKSHLHLVSFLFVPALYYTLKFQEFFHLLVHVYSNVKDMHHIWSGTDCALVVYTRPKVISTDI